jgi:hypothetical protein
VVLLEDMTQIAGNNCGDKDCPGIYQTKRGTFVVQGVVFDKAAPVGEGAVEIPPSVMEEAVRALGG